jgi:hypothetical protein
MRAWGDSLCKEGVASDVVFMSSMFTSSDDLQALRAAAKHGADALLLIKGASATESRLNPLALLNVTIIGGYVVPGRGQCDRPEGVVEDVAKESRRETGMSGGSGRP